MIPTSLLPALPDFQTLRRPLMAWLAKVFGKNIEIHAGLDLYRRFLIKVQSLPFFKTLTTEANTLYILMPNPGTTQPVLPYLAIWFAQKPEASREEDEGCHMIF